jgi:hypothetical protein
LDLAFDLGLDRPRISTVEDWGGKQLYILTFGPPAYRQTVEISPSMSADQVKEKLGLAKEPPAFDVVKQAKEVHGYTPPIEKVEVLLDALNVKRIDNTKSLGPDPELVAAKPQKRKAAKSRK